MPSGDLDLTTSYTRSMSLCKLSVIITHFFQSGELLIFGERSIQTESWARTPLPVLSTMKSRNNGSE